MRVLLPFLAACLTACSVVPRDELAESRDAAGWRPLLGAVTVDLPGPPAPGTPGAEADRAAVAAWATRLATPAGERDLAAVRQWMGADPARLWGAEARRLIGTFDLADPARAARVLAYTQAAAYDALIASWAQKKRFGRIGPGGRVTGLPSYPSEHAAVAVAAAGVLAALLPDQAAGLAARAQAVAEVPVAAGVAFPTDVAAGRAIGEAVAAGAIARYRAEPTAVPAASGAWRDAWPLSPEAGGWAGWTEGAQASAPPPPDGAQTRRELAALVRDNRGIGIKERAIALKWHETDMARCWHARAAELVGRWRLPAPEAARVLAFTSVALADAAIASFRSQYRYGRPRPIALAAGMTEGNDRRSIEPVIATPGHPGYPSDGAAQALAAAGYLAVAFPSEAAGLAAEAAEAAEAGRYAGWEVPSDVAAGRAIGASVAAAVVARAAADGVP